MPIIRIEMWKGRDEQTKGKLIAEVTKTVCEVAKCQPEKVIVVIEDIPKENWGEAGRQASQA
ncbi:hypothetical protein A2311_05895 [candidate division WOR-1 bacterium RIFOXYB2_FULL_48_7]|uniref:4-oxalocrotonate tautomerase-like domain-containing protein n=1 Tax=candidate division WOR-1 bacterium RIFOXYB2_FULL_48_7 TaxID=1802583 RepID=A0A1F4TAC8_UNCSA|nr:MAG: hypothetical protein A2311_05895 [candidate division WOR-1 bacterium RIFOXYB2_FULL_48_7]